VDQCVLEEGLELGVGIVAVHAAVENVVLVDLLGSLGEGDAAQREDEEQSRHEHQRGSLHVRLLVWTASLTAHCRVPV